MIQILGLREFPKNGEMQKYDAFFDKNWRAQSVADIYRNPERYIEKIPEADRWNIYFTAANCGDGKREFFSQTVIMFDIDKIDTTKVEDIINITLAVLGVNRHETGILFSGHGLHFAIGLKKPIRNKDFFPKHRIHYKAICQKILLALQNANIQAGVDTTVWDARRLMRMPLTINRKPNLPEVKTYVIQPNIVATDWDLVVTSGIPSVKADQQIPHSFLRRYAKTDSEAILSKCDFLKFAKEHPDEINEPQWYAALSITARLENGNKLSHDISRGHPNYSESETEMKITQALEASGPRTCENIGNLWDGCEKCPMYQKVKSPIMINSEDKLATENTGFYSVTFKNGEERLRPCFEDLIEFFQRQHKSVVLGGSRMVYVWTGTHYKSYENAFMEAFAIEHMDPKPTMQIAREFRDQLTVHNIEPTEWFQESVQNKVNFLNGVLDLESGSFMPHSPTIGFRYVLPFNYDEYAQAPLYDAMMDRVSGGNKSMVQLLNEFGGFALGGGPYRPDKALVLVGDGANGKTTWVNILKATAGEGNYSGMTLMDIQDSEYNRQLIDGKLFNVSEETSVKSLFDSSTFKRLVGGGALQVRKPYKDPYEINNIAKILVTCNELPQSWDATHGFYRRLIVVPFNRRFTYDDPDYDPNIETKIIATELSGVFNRLYEGYKRLKKNARFTDCEVVAKQIDDYSMDNDTVKRWIKENVIYLDNGHIDDKFTAVSDLYSSYKIACESQCEKPINLVRFSRRLPSLIKDYQQRYIVKKMDKKAVRGLRGVDFAEGAALQPTDSINQTNATSMAN